MKINQEQRAFKAWPILVRKAKSKDTIRYAELSQRIGMSHHRPLRYVLSVIQDYCLRENLPPLTILVVDASGKPGTGFTACGRDALQANRKEVYRYPWSSRKNPFAYSRDGESIKSLAKNLSKKPFASLEVYRKVKDRGSAQQVFRQLLIQAYKGKCAFTGFSCKDGLEATHIVPWSKCEDSAKIAPSNGLLMNSLCHKLFDRGLITLDDSYTIRVSPKIRKISRRLSSSLDKFIVGLDGNEINLPNDKDMWPSIEFIGRHNRGLWVSRRTRKGSKRKTKTKKSV